MLKIWQLCPMLYGLSNFFCELIKIHQGKIKYWLGTARFCCQIVILDRIWNCRTQIITYYLHITFYKAPYFFICHQWFLWRMFNQFWIFLNSFVFQSRRQLSSQISATYQAKLQNSTDASNKKKRLQHIVRFIPFWVQYEVIYLKKDTK